MLRKISLICLLLLTCSVQAASRTTLYQIDMIIFTHHASAANTIGDASVPLIAPNTQHAIQLNSIVSGALTPWHMLPNSSSQLANEYWALNHKTDYQILAHYTWLQPSNNQRAIALPSINRYGWNVEGTLRIRQSNYYLLDTELLFSTPNERNQTAFMFSQKQRLKPGTIYYLDHAQAGMLIKVHQIS